MSASGGTPPYTWSATGLPANLGIDSSTGCIYGEPLWGELGNHNVTITVEDAAMHTVSKDFVLTVVLKAFDNVQEQIYVLDEDPNIGSFEVIVNGRNHGNHTTVIFGSRWGTADHWTHDGVIYANGFTRWKPKGEEPTSETDPCFGTSVVLGPFQLDRPFLDDGYSCLLYTSPSPRDRG